MAKKFAELCDKYHPAGEPGLSRGRHTNARNGLSAAHQQLGLPLVRSPVQLSPEVQHMLDGHLLIGFVQTLYDPSALKPVKLSRQKMRIQQGCPPGQPTLVFFSYPNSA